VNAFQCLLWASLKRIKWLLEGSHAYMNRLKATPIWIDWKHSSGELIFCYFPHLAVLCRRAAASRQLFPWRAPRRVSGLGVHRGGWVVSPSPCCLEACTRGGNKVSGQRFCTTTRNALPHLRSARRRFFTAATLETSTRLWVLVASNFICVLLLAVRTSSHLVFNCLWNMPQTKIW